ncbi:sulfite exporter TauE/SafE family protein [Longispora albida]|uniref:sulfite exporter TauE/SafE family protein n=1 Tax=Longispora albida TaxID=203523 RepID=UPI0003709AF0|nr:TSUP family transporter [Longispora albida]
MELLEISLLTLAGFIAGFIDSIAGGGALILVPALLFAGYSPQLALGTEKYVSTVGTLAALYNFAKDKRVVWSLVGVGVVFAVVGAFIGAQVILLFDTNTIGKIITFLVPLGLAVTLLPKKQKRDSDQIDLKSKKILFGAPALCFVIGFYDGFFGPGTGSMLVLGFHLLLRLGLVEASATSKVFNLASNVGALIAFVWTGNILYLVGIPMLLANIAGNYVGSKVALRGGAKVVRGALVGSLVILFGSLLFKYVF